MNDAVSTFPLLCLPTDAIFYTFRAMHPGEMFGISILSKKTKNLVEFSKITADMFQVEVSRTFEIDVYFLPHYSGLHFKLYHVCENEPLQELETPETFRIVNDRTGATWTNSLSVKQLLDHLKFIFHSPITTLFFKENCERFSLESIHKNVTDIKNISIMSGNHGHNKRILSLFQPASVELVGRALNDRCVPRNILIQNFNVFHVPCVTITLDDLLMTNSRVIDFSCVIISATNVNKFLKLWMKGSNSRLEWMFFRVPSAVRFRTRHLLKGLKYEVSPCSRLFNNSGEKKIEKVARGWVISRFDGTKMTITVRRTHSPVFQFFVWHDHCIID